MLPLFFLGFGAVLSGWFFTELFVGKNYDLFWSNSIFILSGHEALNNAHYVPKWVKLFPIVLGIFGISLATLYYVLIPELPKLTCNFLKPIYLLFYNKWYFDELYKLLFVSPLKVVSNFLFEIFDKKIIDGFGPDGISNKVFCYQNVISILVMFSLFIWNVFGFNNIINYIYFSI